MTDFMFGDFQLSSCDLQLPSLEFEDDVKVGNQDNATQQDAFPLPLLSRAPIVQVPVYHRSPSVGSQDSHQTTPPVNVSSVPPPRFGTVPTQRRQPAAASQLSASSDNNSSSSGSGQKRSRHVLSRHDEEDWQRGEDDDEEDQAMRPDLSHLTQKERNKLSALKYRKRRKMHVANLERKVGDLQQTVKQQNEALNAMHHENRVMREQLDFLKKLFSSQAQSTNMQGPVLPLVNLPSTSSSTTSSTDKKTSLMLFAVFTCFLLTGPFSSPQRDIDTMKSAHLWPEATKESVSSASSETYHYRLMSDRRSGGRMLMGVEEETSDQFLPEATNTSVFNDWSLDPASVDVWSTEASRHPSTLQLAC